MKFRFALTIILIVVLASFFASTFPDGLDFSAQSLGFENKSTERPSIFFGYAFPGLPDGPFSAAASGVIGVVLCFGVFWLVSMLLNRFSHCHKQQDLL